MNGMAWPEGNLMEKSMNPRCALLLTLALMLAAPAAVQEGDATNLAKAPQNPIAGWVWGVGAIAQLDTATDDRLGQGVWGLGPTAVALKITGPWVFGALVNNVWSVSEDTGRSGVNQFLLQPFVNYNFRNAPGRYLSFSPIVTADWKADGGQRWTVPLGLSIGQIAKVGGQALNLQAGAYYNVERPDAAARWQMRFIVALLFPK